jgi:predicted metal-dependent peptidase
MEIPKFFFNTGSDQKAVTKGLTEGGRDRLQQIYKKLAGRKGPGPGGLPPDEDEDPVVVPVNPEEDDDDEDEDEDEDGDGRGGKDEKDEDENGETNTPTIVPIDDHKALTEQGLVDDAGRPVGDDVVTILTEDMLKNAMEGVHPTEWGKVPGGLRGLIEELLRPKIDWRQMLENFIGESIRIAWKPTRKKLHRRFEDQSPGKTALRSGRLWVAIDTSGSIHGDPKMLFTFFSELAEMTKYAEIVAIDIDQGIKRVYTFDPTRVRFDGGGGTDFRPIWAALHEEGLPEDDPRDPEGLLRQAQPDGIVYFTDGYGDYPDPSESGGVPALWIFTVPNMKGPFGESVYLDPSV